MIIERSFAAVAASRLPGGPRTGVEAWWHEPGRFEQKLRGHRGGLEPAAAETWIGALRP